MTYRIAVAENGESYLAKTIVLDAMVRSDGAVEFRGLPLLMDPSTVHPAVKAVLALAEKLKAAGKMPALPGEGGAS